MNIIADTDLEYLRVEPGSPVDISPGVTLTLGELDAGAYSCFTGDGQVRFRQTAKRATLLAPWSDVGSQMYHGRD